MHAIGGLAAPRPWRSWPSRTPRPTATSGSCLATSAAVNLAYSQPQPFGQLPHSDVQPQPQGQALRIPLPRSKLQSIPLVLGRVDGGHRRHSEQDQSGQSRLDKDIWMISRSGRTGRSAQDPRLARKKRSLAALQNDHEFMLRGDVFTPDVIDHLDLVQNRRAKSMPCGYARRILYEFCLYYDI